LFILLSFIVANSWKEIWISNFKLIDKKKKKNQTVVHSGNETQAMNNILLKYLVWQNSADIIKPIKSLFVLKK
jgi:hypothetical protein